MNQGEAACPKLYQISVFSLYYHVINLGCESPPQNKRVANSSFTLGSREPYKTCIILEVTWQLWQLASHDGEVTRFLPLHRLQLIETTSMVSIVSAKKTTRKNTHKLFKCLMFTLFISLWETNPSKWKLSYLQSKPKHILPQTKKTSMFHWIPPYDSL